MRTNYLRMDILEIRDEKKKKENRKDQSNVHHRSGLIAKETNSRRMKRTCIFIVVGIRCGEKQLIFDQIKIVEK